MSTQSAIKTRGVVKSFDTVEVIRNVNINVPGGAIYGLLGVNGSGKTTIFKMLLGLLKPNNGTIEVLGQDIQKGNVSLLRNIGSVIEVPTFYEHLTATENLEIHLEYMNTTGNIKQVLEMVGLLANNKTPVSKYSLGMRQRLGIARALVHKPKLLILDEPINGLDPIGIREMRELFIRLKEQHGMTILISSHILNEIEHVADRIGVIADGNIVQEVSMQSIKEKFPEGLEDYFFDIMSGGRKYA